MKRSIISVFIFSVLLFSCDNNADNKTLEKESYEKSKENLQEKEQKNPRNFLEVDGHDTRNFFGQTVIKGTITNNAKVAIFKDVNLKLSFYSKTNALLETDNETVFEVFHPGETKDFKTKYFAPKGTDSVALNVVSAKVIKE